MDRSDSNFYEATRVERENRPSRDSAIISEPS
jgi:hypothetical protein